MAKVTLTLVADSVKLFDCLREIEGNTSNLGTRIAGALMCGEISKADEIALFAFYNIEVKEITKS